MSTKITRDSIMESLDDMGYDPAECNSTILLDEDVFPELALIAHEYDITVNALANAIFHDKIKEMCALDPPSIPGVGTAPYMAENWDIDLLNKK